MSKNSGSVFAIGMFAGLGVAMVVVFLAIPTLFDNIPRSLELLFGVDTPAQWTTALMASISVGVSIWAVSLIGDTLKVTRKALRSADNAVNVTREIGEKTIKGYLTIERDSVRIYSEKLRAAQKIVLQFDYKNTGQTPIKNIHCSIHFEVFAPAGHASPVSRVLRYDDLLSGERRPYEFELILLDEEILNGDPSAEVHGTIAVTGEDVFGKEVYSHLASTTGFLTFSQDESVKLNCFDDYYDDSILKEENIEFHRSLIKKKISTEGNKDRLYMPWKESAFF